MNDSNYIEKITDSEVIGICVKSPDGTVQSQNKTCKEICGDQKSKICTEGCMALYKKNIEGTSCIGTQTFRAQNTGDSLYDIVMLNDGEQLITILCLLNEKHKTDIEYFKQFGLTGRELEIVGLVIQGNTNKEVSEKLFISKSTIKSHLNSIYRKIPAHAVTVLRKKR